MNLIFQLIIFTNLIQLILCSTGDSVPLYQNCLSTCVRGNCSKDRITIASHAVEYFGQTIFDKLLFWSCSDECQYKCMWRTVNAFIMRGWNVPQFHGKWPFIRFFGLQEPASVLFSLMNLFTHLYLLRKFRREVRPDSPNFKLWHIFAFVCINGWIWSTVFHSRDFPLTELLDYTSAYSIVLVNLYCMIIRLIYDKSIFLRGIISALTFSFYINYFAYLSVGRFSYSFNMKTNIITGILAGLGWVIWSFAVLKKRPYSKKMIIFYLLFGSFMSLEVLDFPPILWTFDAHSLWHLSTVPLCFILYSFFIDDCKALRKEKLLRIENIRKEI